VTWSYDVSDQLIAERRSGASAYANTFTYDSVGNRTLKNANSVRTTFNYDSANQLTYSLAAAGRTTFNYDQAGNQRIEQPPTGARTTTTWNYENQPNVYQLPSATRMTLAYNADNRRISKVTASGTTKFIWDPASDAYQSELDGSNVTQVVYTSPPSQFGQLISQRRSSTSRWYHPDSLGSTRALTDAVQATTDTYLCDAWGNPLSSTGSTVNPFRWVGNVGYYFDSESGLYYIRARVYQPTIARWTSVDPLFYELARSGTISLASRDTVGGNCDSHGLFIYVKSRPIIAMDSSGLRLTVEGDPDGPGPTPTAERGFLIRLLNSLCPEAGGFSQASGSVQPGSSGFCKDTWQTSPCEWSNFIFINPGPYATGKHPVSCKCICTAISHFRTYRLMPRKGITGRWLEGGITIYPKRVQPDQSPINPIIKIGHERLKVYSGPGGRVPAPPYIVLGHELCGHAIPDDYDKKSEGPVEIENEIRREHGESPRDGIDHGDDE
jgi:RHS repeat-associated protein